MPRTAPVLPPRVLALTTVASAALAAPTAHGGETPVNAWLGATDGDWTDPTRWSLGVYPGHMSSSPADIRIDAAGTPYTVLVDAFISRGIETLTVDSPDASVLLEDGTMGASLPSTPGFDHFNVNQGTLRIERYGTLAFRAPKTPNRIGQSASLRIGDTRLTTANISGPLVNEGAISIGDTSRLRIGDISSGGSLYNSTSGEISLARDSELRFASLTNDGVIRVIGDSALLSTTSIEGVNAYFENRGLFHAQRGVEIFATGHHAGEFRADEQASIRFIGTQFFAPGSRLTGDGVFRFDTLPRGVIGGDATVDLIGHTTVDAHFTESIALQLSAPGDIHYATRFDGGSISVSNTTDSIRFDAPVHASQGLLSAARRFTAHQGITTGGVLRVSASEALIEGPITVGGLDFDARSSVDSPPDAFSVKSSVHVLGSAEVGGISGRGPVFEKMVRVGGDIRVVAGEFRGGLDVGGNATFTDSRAAVGDIHVRGVLTMQGGSLFGDVTASHILLAHSLGVDLFATTVTADTLTVRGSELRLRATEQTIRGDVVLEPERTPFTTFQSQFQTDIGRFDASATPLRTRTLSATGSVTLSGNLEVLLFASSAPLLLGDEFLLLSSGESITGEFDELFFPTLSDGLFFDLVYEPSAVRLVVVPSPGAAMTLAGAGLLSASRRRRRRAPAALTATAGATLTALAAPTAHAGDTPQFTRWAAPVSGGFTDPARWESGVAPSDTIGAIIDAAGSPYTVGHSGIGSAAFRSILVDSADATLAIAMRSGSTLNVVETLDLRRGSMTFQGRMSGGALRVGHDARLELANLWPGFDRNAILRLNVVNDGEIDVGGNLLVTQGQGGIGPIPTDRSITNASTGVMRFEGGNVFVVGTLHNHGLIDVINDPAFSGPSGTTLDIEGTALGYTARFQDIPAAFNNHGVVRVHQRLLTVHGIGEHSGRFELLSPDATLRFSGDHTFLPGMEITGPGLTRLEDFTTMQGEIRTEGDLELHRDYLKTSTIDLLLDVGGELTFDTGNAVTITRDLRAGLVNPTGSGSITFQGVVDAGMIPSLRDVRFLDDATIRGDLIASGPGAFFHGAATIHGNATNITVTRGAEIGGDLFGGARGEGRIVVGGDLVATQGGWTFNTPLDAPERTRIEVGGDATIAVPFNLVGDLIVGGAFAAQGGRYENIAADNVLFAPMDSGASAVVIENGSTITSRTAPTVIEGLTLRADPTGGAFGREEIVFEGGLDMRSGAGLGVFVNPELNDASTFVVLGDASLTGTLHISVFGDSFALAHGDSFTVLESRASGADDLATITGSLSVRYLGALADGLFFDLVYEPSAVRLVVLPAPGAAFTLAGAGLLGAARRRRRHAPAALAATAGATLTALAASTASAGGTPVVARWAAPVSGEFWDSANWTGAAPDAGVHAIINAAGSPYTVDWSVDIIRPRLASFLLDSDDARVVMRGGTAFNNSDFRVMSDTVIRRGVLDLNGQMFGPGALRIEQNGTLDVQAGSSGSGWRGAQLALNVFNDGETIVRGGATLTQIRVSDGFSPGVRIVNGENGRMRFEGGNIFSGGALDNFGLITLENDPQFDGAPPLSTNGVAFGVLVHPTVFNNHGVLRVNQGHFGLGGEGLHTGEFHLASPDSTMLLGGVHAFLPSARITGPGTTAVHRNASITGLLNVESDLVYDSYTGEVAPALDVGGTLLLDLSTDTIDFRSLVRAQRVSGSLNRALRFHAAADVAFEKPIASAEFFAPAIVRGDLASLNARTMFHQSAIVTGSVSNAAFLSDAMIGGNAHNVEFDYGASIGGNLTGGASAIGRINVGGNLIATSGNWSFRHNDGASIEGLLTVAGDVTISRPFESEGAIIAQGDFFAASGRFANITADTVRFGSSTSSTGTDISLSGRARIETGGSRAIIERGRLSARYDHEPPNGVEFVTFVDGFEVVYIPLTPFTRSGFSVVVNADTMRSTTFHFLADSILAGTLDVALLGDASALSFGDSFTILDGRPRGGADPVATLTGEFDRLFLPTLPNGLFFDLVYEPSAVRLVVVPSPGAAMTLAVPGLVIAASRRR